MSAGEDFGQLLKQLALLVGEAGGRLHLYLDVEVAAPSPIQVGKAAATNAEDGIGLRAFWDLQCLLALQRRDLDSAPSAACQNESGTVQLSSRSWRSKN